MLGTRHRVIASRMIPRNLTMSDSSSNLGKGKGNTSSTTLNTFTTLSGVDVSFAPPPIESPFRHYSTLGPPAGIQLPQGLYLRQTGDTKHIRSCTALTIVLRYGGLVRDLEGGRGGELCDGYTLPRGACPVESLGSRTHSCSPLPGASPHHPPPPVRNSRTLSNTTLRWCRTSPSGSRSTSPPPL